MIKRWHDVAWDDYLYWQTQDKKTLKKVNEILKDIERNPFNGIGKPEPLKDNLSGCWSRQINSKDRIIYRVHEGEIELLTCRSHYGDH